MNSTVRRQWDGTCINGTNSTTGQYSTITTQVSELHHIKLELSHFKTNVSVTDAKKNYHKLLIGSWV